MAKNHRKKKLAQFKPEHLVKRLELKGKMSGVKCSWPNFIRTIYWHSMVNVCECFFNG